MTDNNKTLVSAGHELASELKADCGAVDMRSVANLLTELASALDVQIARSDALAAEQARYSMPAGEADQRMAESRAVRQALGFGQDADDVAPVDLVGRINALAAALKASEANDADARCHVAELEEKCAALAAENAALKAICEDRRTFIMNGVQLGYIQVPTVETDPALETIRIAVSPQEPTPATDAWVNEQRDAILAATFEAAKQEVERRFGRTFQDCAWLARRSSDTQMKGAVEMAEWVELYAAQLRGSQV
ncbi:eae-like domain protein [Atlantibacter hermannii]|uniref:eae-like domain protein n=1 Tax=Atlantibacter hermannii TaxID=565 RepID=UPI0028B04CBD|nr:eae-like domain protein [Atlantibacter hermannii]